ncbi:MAG: TldD/PmbA family protein [Candidatus Obscuribacterales bacterium]|nr:TldD/PmbA family protein [Candidatus Obscuribacterales bacterium]
MSKLKLEQIAAFVLEAAKKAGATDSFVQIVQSTSFSVDVRDGKFESTEDNDNFGVSFAAYIGKQSASESGHERSRTKLRELVERVVSTARLSPPDQYKGLPEADQMLAAKDLQDFDLLDASLTKVSRKKATELALRAEAAALAYDPRVTISNGGSYAQSRKTEYYANSRGFAAATHTGFCRLNVGVVAASGNEKQTGGWGSSKRYFEDLDTPENLGRLAAQEAVEKLNGRRVKSQVVPMVADRQLAARLLGYFAQAASGSKLYTRQSFLLDKIGQQVAHADINIVDDPHVQRGLASRGWSDHGLPTNRRDIVKGGVLQDYFMDLYSSRRLGTKPNGGQSSNLYIVAGKSTPEEIVASVDNGLFLQEISGHGFNPTNGNISFSASGQWIENGKKAFPVSGITIAGNLLELFLGIEAVGNDLIWDSSTVSPTLKFKSIAVAGE